MATNWGEKAKSLLYGAGEVAGKGLVNVGSVLKKLEPIAPMWEMPIARATGMKPWDEGIPDTSNAAEWVTEKGSRLFRGARASQPSSTILQNRLRSALSPEVAKSFSQTELVPIKQKEEKYTTPGIKDYGGIALRTEFTGDKTPGIAVVTDYPSGDQTEVIAHETAHITIPEAFGQRFRSNLDYVNKDPGANEYVKNRLTDYLNTASSANYAFLDPLREAIAPKDYKDVSFNDVLGKLPAENSWARQQLIDEMNSWVAEYQQHKYEIPAYTHKEALPWMPFTVGMNPLLWMQKSGLQGLLPKGVKIPESK